MQITVKAADKYSTIDFPCPIVIYNSTSVISTCWNPSFLGIYLRWDITEVDLYGIKIRETRLALKLGYN